MDEQLYKKLSPIKVNPLELLLDPNNPRYQGDSPDFAQVPFSEVGTQEAQKRAFETMKEDRFQVRQLAASIGQVGYLPLDNIVVVKFDQNRHLVIEGNRRVTALKMILGGELPHKLDDLNSLMSIPALLLNEPSELAAVTQWLIQGTRHIGGIKAWGPFQKARAIDILMKERGLSAQEAATGLGLGRSELTQLTRARSAFEEVRQDEKYSKFAEADNFSFFIEMLSRPNLRKFFGWDDKANRFTSPKKKALLFWLIFGDPDTGRAPKITVALGMRDLDKVVKSPLAVASLENPDEPLERAVYLAADQTGGETLLQNCLQIEAELKKRRKAKVRYSAAEQAALRRLQKLIIEALLRKR